MIGPRSALFTPFDRLGLIIIDEEHESAYQSEIVPRYQAAEVAARRAEMSGALVVLGSATPSVAVYQKARGNDRSAQADPAGQDGQPPSGCEGGGFERNSE